MYARYFFDMTRNLIREKSFSLVGKDTFSVDIVRDVVNIVPVHWAATQIAGLPLKTRDHPNGAHTELEIYQMLAVIHQYLFLNTRPIAGWILREKSREFSKLFLAEIKGHLDDIAQGGLISLAHFRDSLMHLITGQNAEAHAFLRRLCNANTNATTEQLAYSVLGVIAGLVPSYGQAAAHIINFYLNDEHKAARDHMVELAKRMDDESTALLTGYCLEALRLDPQLPGLFRECLQDTVIEQGEGRESVKIERGDRVFVSLQKANLDPEVFGDYPQKIDPLRPRDSYMLFGHGAHSLLGDDFIERTMPQVIRVVFGLKNVRRAPGQSGQLTRFMINWHGTPRPFYINSKGTVTTWPESLVIQYDV